MKQDRHKDNKIEKKGSTHTHTQKKDGQIDQTKEMEGKRRIAPDSHFRSGMPRTWPELSAIW